MSFSLASIKYLVVFFKMACVVLPSETARLVYGYLVKEKLDNIALQFLEHSPYLTDCYHIVKSGYQFNTKFLYKELHELIQEYSTIQNLVHKKIGLLPKTSPLYKRIKLQCENLSEIIDSFLFSYNESKCEGDATMNRNGNIINDSEKTEKIPEITVNDNNGTSLQNSNSDEYEGISSSNPENDKMSGESEAYVYEESDCRLSNKFAVDKSSSNQTEIGLSCMVENSPGSDISSRIGDSITKKFSEIQAPQESIASQSSKDNIEMNIPVDRSCTDETNKVEMSLLSSGSDVNVDEQIKIVRIEKNCQQNEEKNQLPSNTFAPNLVGMETSMNADNNSVLFVTHDGNIINQDRSQIIVIPIDYYKNQTDIGSGQSQLPNLNGSVTNAVAANSGVIFEEVAVTSNIVPNATSSNTLSYSTAVEKNATVDENIVTEGTFLRNKELIYELESKIKPQIFPESATIQQVMPTPPPVPTPLPTFYLTQLIEQPDSRHRRILPKKEPPVPKPPIVVVQRLGKKKVVKTAKTGAKTVASSGKKEDKKKVNIEKGETKQVVEVLNMPSIRTPVLEKDEIFITEKSVGSENRSDEVENADMIEKISEEKENLETNEKKTETPVVVVNKNSKRLSLSTPRRRSHIRALEFETPPKTANEKKSKTSPKVKVDEVKVKNKNVRNTLFKSPDSDIVFKTPSCLKPDKTCPKLDNFSTCDKNDSSPLSRRGHNAKTSEAWEDVAGICSVLDKTEKAAVPKRSWDANLRDFIPPTSCVTPNKVDVTKKKRTRKSKRSQKVDKKSTNSKKRPDASSKKSKTLQMVPSPSKISLTAKRNTYSISGNEEGSPVRSLLEELDLVTPFKDPEPARSVEETPFTKLFRENVSGLDIDLNMINTPIFPPTPSIIITPDVDDSLSMGGTYYYTPHKDNGKEKATKVENIKNEFVKMDEFATTTEPESVRKKGAKESHEKVIDELVSRAKEIVGLRRCENEEHAVKKPPSGKVLSMVKIQMITQCDKKLCENIPINEESLQEPTSEQGSTLIEKIAEEAAKFDLKCELEEKRQRALRKIKSVKENFTIQPKKKTKKCPVKRKRSGETVKTAKKMKKDSANDSSSASNVSNVSDTSNAKTNDSSEGATRDVEIIHSTPYVDRAPQSVFDQEDSSEKIDRCMLEEIRGEFPSFHDSGELPELPVKTRKKLHYIKHFLKLQEIVKFFENCGEKELPKLKLKRSHRKFFLVFYKWLRHPHAREVNTSERTKSLFKEYRTLFEKIKSAVSLKITDEDLPIENDDGRAASFMGAGQLSDDDGELKKRKVAKKEDDVDDGPVSILPLKKRKATVQPVEMNGIESVRSSTEKERTAENPTRTQTFLQDIDVDRFLSQIHGQENR